MNDMTPSAGLGHNHPPPFDPDILTELVGRTDEFMATSTRIRRDFAPIQTEEHAQLLTDHIAGLRGLTKQIDTARVTAKKPHDDAGKAVQDAFKPVLDRVDKALKAMLDIQTEYGRRKAEEERKRKAEEERLAAEARAEAERLAAEAAKSGDLDAEVAADQAKKDAEALEKQAARDVKTNIQSATGAGRTISMVKVREAQITNISLVFVRYRTNPKLVECLQALANADVRAKEITEANAGIYGMKIIETERAR